MRQESHWRTSRWTNNYSVCRWHHSTVAVMTPDCSCLDDIFIWNVSMCYHDYIHKVPVILHDSLQRQSHKPYGPSYLSRDSSHYTGCPRRKGPNFGRVFLRSNYNDITQNTYIQSSMVTEILAREVLNFDSYYSLIDYQIHIETGRNMWFL